MTIAHQEDVVMIARAKEPIDHHWTYVEYAALPPDGERYEVINGVLYLTPAPNTAHQSANNLIQTYLTLHVQFNNLGRVFGPPCDVELAPTLVVQPDVVVVLEANRSIITRSHIVGTPNLVVEISSPGTAGYDRRSKQDAYAATGVGEYWIVDPAAQTVEILHLQAGQYVIVGVYRDQAHVPSPTLGTLPVQVRQFFA